MDSRWPSQPCLWGLLHQRAETGETHIAIAATCQRVSLDACIVKRLLVREYIYEWVMGIPYMHNNIIIIIYIYIYIYTFMILCECLCVCLISVILRSSLFRCRCPCMWMQGRIIDAAPRPSASSARFLSGWHDKPWSAIVKFQRKRVAEQWQENAGLKPEQSRT